MPTHASTRAARPASAQPPAPVSRKALREALLARVTVTCDPDALEARFAAEDAALEASLAGLEAPTEEELLGLVSDPESDPPEEDEWLAGLPGELQDEYFAATAPPAGPEPIMAGFYHGSSGDGWGFASGGASDALPPGPVLAGLAGRAWDDGLELLDDDALVGVLCAARRLSSWAAALELSAAADLVNRRFAQEEAGEAGVAEHADAELAAALTLTGRAAGRLLDLAVTLDRLPATMAALRAGEIDQPRAAVIADETSLLGPGHRAAVEQHLLRRASGQTTGELRTAAKRAVIAADPAAARQRKHKAQQDARVERWAEDAGTAALAGRDLPPAGVLAADQHLSGIARALKDAGAAGTMDNLRALAYLTLLSGQPISSLFAPIPGTAATGTGAGADDPGAAAGPSGTTSTVPPGLRSPSWAGADNWPSAHIGTGPTSASGLGLPPLTGKVNLTMPLATWLGLSQAPGNAAGYGVLDATDARALGAALAQHATTTWCITLTDPHGHPVAHGCASPHRRPDKQRRKPATGSRMGPGAGTSSAAAPRAGPGLDDAAWNFVITPLAGNPCSHLRETGGYRPSAGLRHVLEIRQATCSYIGCRRPAERCDIDHTVPYDQGGRTCICNLGPACRCHHRTKQTPRWRLEQPRPGVFAWTTPSGRRYTTHPTQYLE